MFDVVSAKLLAKVDEFLIKAAIMLVRSCRSLGERPLFLFVVSVSTHRENMTMMEVCQKLDSEKRIHETLVKMYANLCSLFKLCL